MLAHDYSILNLLAHVRNALHHLRLRHDGDDCCVLHSALQRQASAPLSPRQQALPALLKSQFTVGRLCRRLRAAATCAASQWQ